MEVLRVLQTRMATSMYKCIKTRNEVMSSDQLLLAGRPRAGLNFLSISICILSSTSGCGLYSLCAGQYLISNVGTFKCSTHIMIYQSTNAVAS
jgi:hypothetical protein